MVLQHSQILEILLLSISICKARRKVKVITVTWRATISCTANNTMSFADKNAIKTINMGLHLSDRLKKNWERETAHQPEDNLEYRESACQQSTGNSSTESLILPPKRPLQPSRSAQHRLQHYCHPFLLQAEWPTGGPKGTSEEASSLYSSPSGYRYNLHIPCKAFWRVFLLSEKPALILMFFSVFLSL